MKLRYILLTLLALCLLAAPAAAAGGAGTAANPYVIQTAAELQSVQNDLSAYYVLGNNIDMSGYNFVPIGSTAAPFFGSLDGQGFTISNLNINLPDQAYVGLFAVIGPGAHIENINFADCSITGTSNVGTLCGRANGAGREIVIENINLQDCTILGSTINVGGISGANGLSARVTISDCDINNSRVISGTNLIGGVIGAIGYGANTNGIVQDCTVSNCVISGASSIGGICGIPGSAGTTNGTVQDCTVSNCVISGSTNIGGICGSRSDSNPTTGNIINCVVEDCTVRATTMSAGGIAGSYGDGVGEISGSSVSNSTILANQYAGGICPYFTGM